MAASVDTGIVALYTLIQDRTISRRTRAVQVDVQLQKYMFMFKTHFLIWIVTEHLPRII